MDGDHAPLREIVALKKKFGAWLMVDEAHATGVLGKQGRGGAEHFGVEGRIDVSMGTFSKALGCLGGFICGSPELRNMLINRARSFVYSTGLPEAVCRAGLTALRVVQAEPGLRERLWDRIRLLGNLLRREPASPIVPWMVGEEDPCVRLAEGLRKKGLFVPAIRYPTVARGKARLRISVSAAHTEADIRHLAEALPGLRPGTES